MQNQGDIQMKKMKHKRFVLILFIFSFATSSFLFASFNPLSIPDSALIRQNLYYTWFTRSLNDLREEKPIMRKNEAGDYFHISFREYEREFAIVCNPMDTNLVLEKAAGTWILYRDKKSEKILCIEFYFTNNPEVFFVFKPKLNKTTIDLRVYNAFLVKDLSFALAFEDFYTLSFTELYKLSKNLLPWHYFTIDEKSYDANIQIASQLKDYESKISFAPNRVYDENGQLSHIFDEAFSKNAQKNLSKLQIEKSDEVKIEEKNETIEILDEKKLHLSSLGYVKWLVDGLVFPQIASYLKIEPLKKPTFDASTRARVETLRAYESIFASLDWTRNLATAFVSVQLGRDLVFADSGVEVNRSFFALSLDENGNPKDSSYVPNSGYSAHILKPLLYMLALTEPERIYLAAIKEFQLDFEAGKQDIGRYYDALIFLPYFDQEGVFQCPVFYAGKEVSLDELILNSKNDFFSLVRIKSDLRFFPLKK